MPRSSVAEIRNCSCLTPGATVATSTVISLSTNQVVTRMLKHGTQLPCCFSFWTGADLPASVEAGQWPVTHFYQSHLPQARSSTHPEHCYIQEARGRDFQLLQPAGWNGGWRNQATLLIRAGKYLRQCLLKSSYILLPLIFRRKVILLTLVSQPSFPRALLTTWFLMAPKDPEGLKGSSPLRLKVSTTGLRGPVDLAKTASQTLRAQVMNIQLYLGIPLTRRWSSGFSISSSREEAVWSVPYRTVPSKW